MSAKRVKDSIAQAQPVSAIDTVRAGDVQPQQIQWLWPGRIALGKITLIAGDPGLGKSLISVAMASTVSNGGHWPVDHAYCPAGSVLMVSGEDDIADTIRPRLDAAGADVNRVHILKSVVDVDHETGELRRRPLSLKQDAEALDQKLQQLQDCKLVVVDPVSAYLDGTDSHKNADVRALLLPLADIAMKHAVAIVAVTHLSKGGGQPAQYRAMGSLAFVAAARAAFVVAKDQDNDRRRLILPIKNNLGNDSTGFAYTIITADNNAPCLAWEPDPVTISADDALAPPEPEDDKPKLAEACDWLIDLLKDGPVTSKEVKNRARADGLSWGTVRLAQEELDIKPGKTEFSKGCAGHFRMAFFTKMLTKLLMNPQGITPLATSQKTPKLLTKMLMMRIFDRIKDLTPILGLFRPKLLMSQKDGGKLATSQRLMSTFAKRLKNPLRR